MNKIIFSLLALLVPLQVINAEATKTEVVTFKKSDFTFSRNDGGELVISSKTFNACFDENSGGPGLPLVPVNILIPQNFSYKNLTVDLNETLLEDDVIIAPNPIPMITDSTTKLQDGVSSGQLVISSMTGNREKTLVVSNVMPNVTENISSLNSGIHIVSLYVNGKLTDSQRLIIE
jgi:hypothetical protein